ncbi:MAG: substrate-binding domain-containing protein [Opitutales bacterium]|nr:substrate-binding domain-containing protein [Opitutales bacterium]MCH8541270.1 substrate-binding domain-containing protein [Opitutales bacterium]
MSSSPKPLLDIGICASPRYPPFTDAILEIVREGWKSGLWRSQHGFSPTEDLERWEKENHQFDAMVGILATKEHLHKALTMAPAILSLSSAQPPHSGVGHLFFDPEAIGRMAAEHLLAKGISAGAYYSLYSHYGLKKRGEAFAKTIEAAGIPFLGTFTRKDTLPIEKIRKQKGPVGFFAGDDELAAPLSAFLAEQGIDIPWQAMVIGVNNQEYLCHFGPVPLSSIELDGKEMGRQASQFLRDLATGRSRFPKEIVLIPPSGVITRASTDPTLVGDYLASQALSNLRQATTVPANVEEWAAMIGSSRRPLEKRLRQVLGQTPKQLLDYERIRRATYLLQNTRLPMENIAEKAGFSSGRHLRETFLRLENRTPSDIRGHNP